MKNSDKDRDLRTRLSAEEYRVTQEGATEPPFANRYWDNHEKGIYVDVVSGDLLFSSEDKFDSGTGWPSFSRPVNPDAIGSRLDHSHEMERIEVRGAKSGSHLGHIFTDGPNPDGLRYCVNSAALRFIPEAESTAVFAAGCFWGTEAYFREIRGVLSVSAGYTGGRTSNPTYEDVCSGNTGHAEAVRIAFNPGKITYRDLLRHFFRMHDPTTRDRQGNDRGTQYRSCIFFMSESQRRDAETLIQELTRSGKYTAPIVTELVQASGFYPAEEYHQAYLEKNPGGYCHVDLSLAEKPLDE